MRAIAAPSKGIELQISTSGYPSRVVVDGVDISHHVYRVAIVADAEGITRIRLSCFGTNDEPYVIRGRLVADQ